MANLKETAQAYEPKKTLNIADLEAVSLEVPMTKRSGTDKDGKNYEFHVANIDGEDYRVPSSVLEEIGTLLETKPEVKTIKVAKKGSGMNTSYSIIELE